MAVCSPSKEVWAQGTPGNVGRAIGSGRWGSTTVKGPRLRVGCCWLSRAKIQDPPCCWVLWSVHWVDCWYPFRIVLHHEHTRLSACRTMDLCLRRRHENSEAVGTQVKPFCYGEWWLHISICVKVECHLEALSQVTAVVSYTVCLDIMSFNVREGAEKESVHYLFFRIHPMRNHFINTFLISNELNNWENP